jgi:SAM-dependent methyltransferase
MKTIRYLPIHSLESCFGNDMKKIASKPDRPYLMESTTEIERLEMKTRGEDVIDQARWAGIRPGQRVADIGCGSGKTSFHLLELVQPGGEVVGIDASPERIAYARRTYVHPDLSFACRDFLESLSDLGGFDFIWIRFILEYYRNESAMIVQRAYEVLRPGGILCLIDLDHNCLSHHELSPNLSRALEDIMANLAQEENFDPYAGRKLYAHLFDLKMSNIRVDVRPHNLIYGSLGEVDRFNWEQKIFVAARRSEFIFHQYYENGTQGFIDDFQRYFSDPRRFTYTPMILCYGMKPQN